MILKDVPQELKQYEHIAQRFSKIPGVELIGLQVQGQGAEVTMHMTNNKPGASNVRFSIPLRTCFFVAFSPGGGATPGPQPVNSFGPSVVMQKSFG